VLEAFRDGSTIKRGVVPDPVDELARIERRPDWNGERG
jgi:hypothetical protein